MVGAELHFKPVGGELLDAAVVNSRISANQPDFAPVSTLARGILDSKNRVVASGQTNLSPSAKGQFAITNGTQDITVTGLGLGFTPIGGDISVIHATSGKTEVRGFFVGSPTADGFVCHLTSAVADGTYSLAFWLY